MGFFLQRFRFVSAALAAYKKLPTSNASSLPTAVLLPCAQYVSGLASCEVTDYDLRVSTLGAADSDGCACLLYFRAPCCVCWSRLRRLAESSFRLLTTLFWSL